MINNFFIATVYIGMTVVANAQLPFSDSFDSDTSENYSIINGRENSSVNDFRNIFGFDYSKLVDRNSNEIPEAPNTSDNDSPKSGMLIQVNMLTDQVDSDTTEPNATTFNFYPDTGVISGNHSLTFDVYYRAGFPGPSQELIFGLNTSGSFLIQGPQFGSSASNPIETDGYIATTIADFGTGNDDFSFFEGNPNAQDTPLDPTEPAFRWGDPNLTVPSRDGVSAETIDFFLNLFPNPPFEPIDFGFSGTWVTFRLSSINGKIVWEVDSQQGRGFKVISVYNDPDDTYLSGVPVFGVADHFRLSENDEAFWLFDNIVVEEITDVTSDYWILLQK